MILGCVKEAGAIVNLLWGLFGLLDEVRERRLLKTQSNLHCFFPKSVEVLTEEALYLIL